jgi:formamidopyrimidine-DNA glycosylase
MHPRACLQTYVETHSHVAPPRRCSSMEAQSNHLRESIVSILAECIASSSGKSSLELSDRQNKRRNTKTVEVFKYANLAICKHCESTIRSARISPSRLQ